MDWHSIQGGVQNIPSLFKPRKLVLSAFASLRGQYQPTEASKMVHYAIYMKYITFA